MKHRQKKNNTTLAQKQKNFQEVRENLRKIAEEEIKKIKDNFMKMSEQEMEEARKLFDEISDEKIDQQENNQQIVRKNHENNVILNEEEVDRKKEMNKQKILKNLGGNVNIQANQQDMAQENQQIQYVVFDGSRKWNEKLENPKLGKFEPHQKNLLMKSFTQYIVQENLELPKILDSLNSKDQKIPNNLKMWTCVCSVLPNRTLKSSYKYLIRKLNSKNRLGKWTAQEQQELIDMQKRLGNKWALIAQKFGRTPQNIRDKFRCIRKKEQNESQQNNKKFWKIQDLISFVKEIQTQTKIKFLDNKIDDQLANAQKHNNQQLKNRQQMNIKYNSKMSIHHNNVVLLQYLDAQKFNQVNSGNIKWKHISDILGSKTQIDCKNKYYELVKIINRDPKGKYGVKVVGFIQKIQPDGEKDIDWDQWVEKDYGITRHQAKNRWFLIKKKIQGRSQMSFNQILMEAKKIVQKRRQSYLSGKKKQNDIIDKKIERTVKMLKKKKEKQVNQNEHQNNRHFDQQNISEQAENQQIQNQNDIINEEEPKKKSKKQKKKIYKRKI